MPLSARELYELSDGGKLSYDEVVARHAARQRTKADWDRRIAEEEAESRRREAESRRSAVETAKRRPHVPKPKRNVTPVVLDVQRAFMGKPNDIWRQFEDLTEHGGQLGRWYNRGQWGFTNWMFATTFNCPGCQDRVDYQEALEHTDSRKCRHNRRKRRGVLRVRLSDALRYENLGLIETFRRWWSRDWETPELLKLRAQLRLRYVLLALFLFFVVSCSVIVAVSSEPSDALVCDVGGLGGGDVAEATGDCPWLAGED